MQKIKITKDYKEYKKGNILTVFNNTAHSLIDKGIAKIFKAPKDKMIRARKVNKKSKRK